MRGLLRSIKEVIAEDKRLNEELKKRQLKPFGEFGKLDNYNHIEIQKNKPSVKGLNS